MKKLAATSKNNQNGTSTNFVSHMCDYFQKKIMMIWNTIRVFIKIHTQQQ